MEKEFKDILKDVWGSYKIKDWGGCVKKRHLLSGALKDAEAIKNPSPILIWEIHLAKVLIENLDRELSKLIGII